MVWTLTFREGVVAAAQVQIAVDQRLAAARPVGGFGAGIDVAAAAEGLPGCIVARTETGARGPYPTRCPGVCCMYGSVRDWMEW